MTTAMLPTRPPDGRRAGAAWVAGTGAFLLVAAASVFIAVRWEQVPEAAKLGLVVALTGAFLAGGRAIRRTLPATGDVLFHLGALLIPVDVAAVGLRLHLGWRALLLTEGIFASAVLGGLAGSTRSVVLRRAAQAAVVVMAAGTAAVSPLPAPLVVAGAAVVAALLARREDATFWAVTAGLSPVAGALVTAALGTGVGPGAGVLTELGLGGHAAALAAVASSALAAVVLGREATRRHDLTLVALAGACLTTGAATTWVNASPPREVSVLAGPALFLLVQAATMLGHRDPFWGRVARAGGLTAEVAAAAIGAPAAVLLVLAAPFIDGGFGVISPGWTPRPAAALAWALLAGGWLLAGWRRAVLTLPTGSQVQGPSRPTAGGAPGPSGRHGMSPEVAAHGGAPGSLVAPHIALGRAVAAAWTVSYFALSVVAALVAGTGSTIGVAIGLVALAGALIASAAGLDGRRGAVANVVAVAAVAWAPLVVGPSHPLVALPVGLMGAAVLGAAALAWGRAARGWASGGLASAGSLVSFCACAIAQSEIGLTPAMLIAVVVAWALAVLVERAVPLAGHVVRATMVVGVAGSVAGTYAQMLPVAVAASVLFALDAVRHDEPIIGVGAGLGVPLVVGVACGAAGLAGPTTGLILCATAGTAVVAAVPLPASWRLPFAVTATAGLIAGLLLAAGDPARFAESLMVGGGLAAALGVLARSGTVGHIGGAVAFVGLAVHLGLGGVTASEAYSAPVALQLIVAGWQLRRREGRPSSWVAFGPAFGLLGAAALAERVAGGPPWHSLVAGAVGVAAVTAGGWRRLAGPLFLGTGLLAAVTVLESLTTLAGIPTWGWLAAGGTFLLATGVALERSATSPVEVGRRLVDVVDERFS